MYKLITIAVFLFGVVPYAKADDAVMCLKSTKVQISQLVPETVHVVDMIPRKNSIELRMPIDCETGVFLVPDSLTQSKDWLDLALPYDFKSGLLSNDYFEPYTDTRYGSSVEFDLYQYFNAHWNLKPDTPPCKDAPPLPHAKKGLNWCFYQLLNGIRTDYKGSKAPKT